MTPRPALSPTFAPAHGPWHAATVGDVADALGVDPAMGLSDDDARRRLGNAGPNRLPESRRRSSLALFADQFRNVLVWL